MVLFLQQMLGLVCARLVIAVLLNVVKGMGDVNVVTIFVLLKVDMT